MVNLVKIDQVYLYTGATKNTDEQVALKKALDKAEVPYVELTYNDPLQHNEVFAALNTWSWGERKESRKFTDFPIVHWKEYYDTWHTMDFNVTSVSELKKSSLLKNKALVQVSE